MKRPWVKFLLVGFIGIVIGRLLPVGHPAGVSAAQEKSTGSAERGDRGVKASRRDESAASVRLDRWRKEVRSAKSENMPMLVSRAMEFTDPLERREALMEVLKYADASNGMAIIQGFAKLTRETGRDNSDEWKTSLFEVGRKGGAEILTAWKANGKTGTDQEMWNSLYGMAFNDPKAALEWVNGNEDIPGNSRLLSAVVCGAALTNPDEGIRMLANLPPESRNDCIADFSWNLVQNSGLDRAVDWMLDVQKTSGTTDPEFAQAVEDQIFGRIFGATRYTDGASEMAGYLTRINNVAPISSSRLASTVARMPGTAGLDVMNSLASNRAMANSEAAGNALAMTVSIAARRSPDAVQQWLEQHPSSPIASQIRQVLDNAPRGEPE